MKRRKFLKNTAIGSLAGLASVQTLGAVSNNSNAVQKSVFKLNFAPHIDMFKHHAGESVIDQIQFMADHGFTAFEDNGMRARSVELQNNIAKVLQKNNMIMGVFVGHNIDWSGPNLAGGNKDKRAAFLNEIKGSIEVAKRVNAKWMTIVPGCVDFRLDVGYQTAHVIESLKQASAILEPHNLTMVLEPLNFRDHPKLFLTKISQAYQICKAVDSPSCKILFDIYHQQIQEGNLIPNMEMAWDEIAYFQIGDNPGRNEPTTGEINYKNIFDYIHKRNFQGVMGMEHGNSIDGKEGELAVIEAYKSVG